MTELNPLESTCHHLDEEEPIIPFEMVVIVLEAAAKDE